MVRVNMKQIREIMEDIRKTEEEEKYKEFLSRKGFSEKDSYIKYRDNLKEGLTRWLKDNPRCNFDPDKLMGPISYPNSFFRPAI